MTRKMSRQELKRMVEKTIIRDEEKKRIDWSATSGVSEILLNLNSSLEGLDDGQIQRNRQIYGENRLTEYGRKKVLQMLVNCWIKPSYKVLRRQERAMSIPSKDLVVGDIVLLSEGDKVPGDLRVITSVGLFVDQGDLTGDRAPASKGAGRSLLTKKEVVDYTNILLMGSRVVSGKAKAVVLSVGDHTIFGTKL